MVKVIIQKSNGEIVEVDDVVRVEVPQTENSVIEVSNRTEYVIEDDVSLNTYYQDIFDILGIEGEVRKIEYEPGKKGDNLNFYMANGDVVSMTAYWDYGVQKYIPDETLRYFIASTCLYNLIDEGLFPVNGYNMLITRADGFFVYVPKTNSIEHFTILEGYSEGMKPDIVLCHNFTLGFNEFERYREYIDWKTPYDLEVNGRNFLMLKTGFLRNDEGILDFVLNLQPDNPTGISRIRVTAGGAEYIKRRNFF